MKNTAFLSVGLVLAQAQITPYDTTPDYHNWIIPVGVGAGAVHRSTRTAPQMSRPVHSRAISGAEARKRGNAHYVASDDPTLCYRMARKYGWRVKEHPPALGGGRWCIFHGEQTSFGGGDD